MHGMHLSILPLLKMPLMRGLVEVFPVRFPFRVAAQTTVVTVDRGLLIPLAMLVEVCPQRGVFQAAIVVVAVVSAAAAMAADTMEKAAAVMMEEA